MQLIYKAENITEAQIVKGLLESNGIHAYASGFYLQGGVGEMATMDFANIHVPDDECDRARAIIDEYENAQPEPSGFPAAPDTRRSTVASRLLITIMAAAVTALLLYFVVT